MKTKISDKLSAGSTSGPTVITTREEGRGGAGAGGGGVGGGGRGGGGEEEEEKEPWLPWKSNKYYVLFSRARMRPYVSARVVR